MNPPTKHSNIAPCDETPSSAGGETALGLKGAGFRAG